MPQVQRRASVHHTHNKAFQPRAQSPQRQGQFGPREKLCHEGRNALNVRGVSENTHSLRDTGPKIVDQFNLVLVPVIFLALRNETFITLLDVTEGSHQPGASKLKLVYSGVPDKLVHPANQ